MSEKVLVEVTVVKDITFVMYVADPLDDNEIMNNVVVRNHPSVIGSDRSWLHRVYRLSDNGELKIVNKLTVRKHRGTGNV